MVLIEQAAFWCLVLKIWLCYALNKWMNGTYSTRVLSSVFLHIFFKDRIPYFKRKHWFCTNHFFWGHQLRIAAPWGYQLRIAAPNIQLNHCLTLKAIDFPVSNIQLNHCLIVAALNSQLDIFFVPFQLLSLYSLCDYLIWHVRKLLIYCFFYLIDFFFLSSSDFLVTIGLMYPNWSL